MRRLQEGAYSEQKVGLIAARREGKLRNPTGLGAAASDFHSFINNQEANGSWSLRGIATLYFKVATQDLVDLKPEKRQVYEILL